VLLARRRLIRALGVSANRRKLMYKKVRNKRMRNYSILLLLVMSVISTACANRPASANTTNTKIRPEQATASKTAEANEPCTLIKKDEAAEILGLEVKMYSGPPVTSGGKRIQRCRYYTTTALLDILVTSPVTPPEFEKAQIQMESDQANKVQSLSGIGDQALIVGRGGTATLNMLKGNTAVGLSILDKARISPGASPDESFKIFSENLKTLGAKAASRVT
jgi:hypothetical protein